MDGMPVFEGLTDPTAWLRLARSLAKNACHEDALRAHVFYHRHAPEVEDAQFGVRLSLAWSEWARLAPDYPPALDALRTTRREAAALTLDCRSLA